MKIKSTELKRLIAAVKPTIPTSTTLPILRNILIRAGGGKVTVTSSNGNIQLDATGECEGELSIVVPPERLLPAANAGPEMSIDLDQSQLKIKCGRSRYTANGIAASEFPLHDEPADEGWIELPTIASALSAVAFSAAEKDIQRPFLNGVKLDVSSGALRASGTNGYRLAIHRGDAPADVSANVLIPRPVATLLSAMNATRVMLLPARIVAKTDHLRLSAQTMNATYPDVERVVPAMKKTVTMDTAALREALIGLEGYAMDAGSPQVKIVQSGGELRLSARTAKDEEEAVSSLPADGDDHEVVLAFRQFKEVIDRISSETTTIGWSDCSQSARRVDDGGTTYVLMPFKV